MKRNDQKRFKNLVTEHLKILAAETVNVDDPDHAETITVTRAEALARSIWLRALGQYREEDPKTGKVKRLPADKAMMDIILDRTEGKVGNVADAGRGMESIPDRISRQSKERLNKLA